MSSAGTVQPLWNKVAIVTGGGQGLGRALCARLAQEGAHVVVADINAETANETAAAICGRTEIRAPTARRALAIPVNVTDEAQVEAMVQRTVDEFGRLDVLVSNAGVLRAGPVQEFDAEAWRFVIDVNLDRMEYLDDIYGNRITTLKSHSQNIERSVIDSDLVVGGVLITGAKAPKLVTREMVSKMQKGSVIVDVAVDQGGCVETCKPTTHDDPTYVVDGVVHYCVANMPGAVGRTSTFALCNVTLPYAQKIASLGIETAARHLPPIAAAVNVHKGRITNRAVAESFDMPFNELENVL